MKRQDSKQRLFEVLARLDKTFKPKLNERSESGYEEDRHSKAPEDSMANQRRERNWSHIETDPHEIDYGPDEPEEVDEYGDSPQTNAPLKFIKGWGYWDVTKYPYGGDFKRFDGSETGQLIKGTVKLGDEIRVKLDNGREIVAPARAVMGMDFDELLSTADTMGRMVVGGK